MITIRAPLFVMLFLLISGCAAREAVVPAGDASTEQRGLSSPSQAEVVELQMPVGMQVGLVQVNHVQWVAGGNTPPIGFDVKSNHSAGGTAIAYWNTTTSAVSTLRIILQKDENTGFASQVGQSPLRLDLKAHVPAGRYEALAWADSASVTLATDVHVVVSFAPG